MLIVHEQTINRLGGLEMVVPRLIAAGNERAGKRFIEFFTAGIRNPNTRESHGRVVRHFFVWCDKHGVGHPAELEPAHIAVYVDRMLRTKLRFVRYLR